MERKGSRRSFIADVFGKIAGGWLAMAGLVGLSSALTACSDDAVAKYGPLMDLGPAPKYGVPDVGPVVKYGALFDGGSTEGGVAPKYGIKIDGGAKG